MLKILSIGNSFSQDAQRYLTRFAKAAGVDILTHNLEIGGCSLEQHWNYFKNDDKNYALEQICGSEVTVEYDKLIDRQLERAAVTSISGFAKLFGDASKVLTLQ